MPQSILFPVLPDDNQREVRWHGLTGSATSLAIAQLAELNRPLLVITPDTLALQHLASDLTFFLQSHHDVTVQALNDWEILPYDHFSPNQDITASRLRLLSDLPTSTRKVTLVAANTLQHYFSPREFIEAHSFQFSVQQTLNLNELAQRLTRIGYYSVSQVRAPGEFCLRGALVDIYPSGAKTPFRLDLFDNEIESIREFDPETQRSVKAIDKIDILPAREFPLTEEAIATFRKNWRDQFSGNPLHCPIYENVSQEIMPAGIEYYIPLFFQDMVSLFDYLPDNTLVIQYPEIAEALSTLQQNVWERYEQLRHDVSRPLLPPEKVVLTADACLARAKHFQRILIAPLTQRTRSNDVVFDVSASQDFTVQHRLSDPFQALREHLQHSNLPTLLLAESPGRQQVLLESLRQHQLQPSVVDDFATFLQTLPRFALTHGLCQSGLVTDSFCLITEAQLYGQKPQLKTAANRPVNTDAVIRNLTELSIGAPVVHIQHGVGRYLGLRKITVGDLESEYLTLEYANQDKIYIPVTALDVISRYRGDDPPLDKLGHDKWQKTKQKALEKIRDAAAELLRIYAKRAAKPGFAYRPPDEHFHAFVAEFPFAETPDQLTAINAVIHDMTQPCAMDRLICGDVGFGKTEVAMRAAFLAVNSGKQVAVLVPTTLLATQHYANFTDRFANFPIEVAVLSRFNTGKEQQTVKSKIASGEIDIVIGTHKLLQKNLSFHDLGLVIIDEEHRFGVRQKEVFKALRADIDVLSLTATPIPRTLNLSLAGLRDISIIATPPQKRLSIKTFAQTRQAHIIREAILREIMRGGQVFLLHNDIQTIHKIREEVIALVPQARVNIAHGQMRERELESIMSDFYHQRFNVLICTTIIETGIDIPTANTIIIDRADKFGLAQLHQLRGRVGRSHHQAYAYLMLPEENLMTNDAKKRLAAISSLEDLGAGFTLATHDLEIRGAGELLGEEQSGQIQAIGFTLYRELLDKAVKALQQGRAFDGDPANEENVEIQLKMSALIPDEYVPDVALRLTLYKRIADCENETAIRELQVELIDRFGLLPQPLKNLLRVQQLKCQAKKLGIKRIDTTQQGGKIEFLANPNVKPETILRLIQQHSDVYQLDGPTRLSYVRPGSSQMNQIDQLAKVLEALT